MNLTHLHLLITHLPIYGSVLGTLVLVYGMITKSSPTKIAAYYVLVIAAIGGVIAFSTGEPAEETVEKIQGVGKSLIEEHEEFAKSTLVAIITLGFFSIAGIYFTLKKLSLAKPIATIVLIISLVCFGMTSWTGYLGGQIRHTEIGPGATSQGQDKAQNDD
jgi:uncharacterized membrane protein